MKTTFKLICLALVAMGIMCCTKSELNEAKSSEITTMDAKSAKKEFAKILSKAVYKYRELRAFLKEDALRQYNNDYEIFYPLIKNEIIGDTGLSFREILSMYDDTDILYSIEEILPLLTILVPDWAWIDETCFSVANWDINDDDIAVGYEGDEIVHSLYVNGEKAGDINSGEFPAFPVVIVKNNERIKISSTFTKSSDIKYEFIDDAFNGTKNVETKSVYDKYWDYDKDGSSKFVPTNKLDDLVVGAYKEFGQRWGNAMHRDYIYYGLSKTKTTDGELNTFISERILRFQIDPSARASITDPGKDPYFIEQTTKWRNKNALKGNEIQQYLWSDGAFEICFTFYTGIGLPDIMSSYKKVFSVRPQELWEITKSSVKKTLRPFDGFKNRYVYTSNTNDLVAKWYYPKYDLDLPFWDISAQSSNIWFNISEYDDKTTTTETVTKSYKYAHNFKLKTDVSIEGGSEKVKVKSSLGLEYDYGEEKSETTTSTITIDHVSNNMGDCSYSFDMPIIISSEYVHNGEKGYDLKDISAGSVCITIVPYDKRF